MINPPPKKRKTKEHLKTQPYEFKFLRVQRDSWEFNKLHVRLQTYSFMRGNKMLLKFEKRMDFGWTRKPDKNNKHCPTRLPLYLSSPIQHLDCNHFRHSIKMFCLTTSLGQVWPFLFLFNYLSWHISLFNFKLSTVWSCLSPTKIQK